MADPAAHGVGELAATRIAEVLREQITEGRIRPGAALRETSLAAALGASRNTVREAFRLLAYDGLVEHERNRGVAVRRLSEADVADIYRIRRALERLGLEQAAGQPGRAAALAALVTEAEAAAGDGDWAGVATGDLRFHQAIVASLGSERLDQMCRRVLAELRLGFAAMPDPAAFHRPYLARNRVLVELLHDGNLDACLQELAHYLDDAESQILGVLRLRADMSSTFR